MQRLAGRLASFALRRIAVGVLLGTFIAPAYAEFEIQESIIEEGEIQLQYRGAWHSGLAKGDKEIPVGDVLPDDEEAPLRQSHEAELQMSITSHWLMALTHAFDMPDDDTVRLSAIEGETQFELITLEGNGIGFAVQGGIEKPLGKAKEEEAGDIHFGPIMEVAKDRFLLTLNPLFFKEQGALAEQEGFGFEYGWQARYDVSPKLYLALEMFGEIEDMSNAGPFNQQLHSLGPAFYYVVDNSHKGFEEGEKGSAELTLSLGAQFGLTEATSDFALKVFIGYEYF